MVSSFEDTMEFIDGLAIPTISYLTGISSSLFAGEANRINLQGE
jgi:hypothetical protein